MNFIMRIKNIVIIVLIFFAETYFAQNQVSANAVKLGKENANEHSQWKMELDTTMFRYFDIDGDGVNDTISTTIFVRKDTILIKYLWLKEKKIIWSDTIRDVYLTIQTDDAAKRDWLNFIIDGANPNIYKISDFEHLIDYSVGLGVEELRDKGYYIDNNEYKRYIINYKGSLFEYGHPEMAEGLFIWFEPLKTFILFYQP